MPGPQMPIKVIFRRLATLSGPILRHPAMEVILPDVAAIYGMLEGTKFALLEPSLANRILHADPQEAETTREVIALSSGEFTVERVSDPLQEDVPIFTNAEDTMVAPLLLAPRWSRALCDSLKPKAKTLLAVFPSETRIIWSPVDTREMAATLRTLCQKGRDLEEEDFLCDEVVRFDGVRWAPVTPSTPS
jgi:hypothetical protein